MMQRLSILVVALCLWTACSKKTVEIPENIIQPDKMVEILVDVRLAEANNKVASQMGRSSDELLDSSYFVVCKYHHVSMQDLDSSYRYYAMWPEMMKEINEKVLEKLNKLQ